MKKKRVTTDDLIGNYSGLLGNKITVENKRGKSIVVIPRKSSKQPPSQKQISSRRNFISAARYAVNVLKDPDMLERYAAKADAKRSPYVIAVTDFFKPPVVTSVDTDGYTGKTGSVIRVRAFDDFELKEVTVAIAGPDGAAVEKGTCAQDPVSGLYDYTCTKTIASLAGVTVTAVARDYPNHTGELSVTL